MPTQTQKITIELRQLKIKMKSMSQEIAMLNSQRSDLIQNKRLIEQRLSKLSSEIFRDSCQIKEKEQQLKAQQ